MRGDVEQAGVGSDGARERGDDGAFRGNFLTKSGKEKKTMWKTGGS